MTTVQKQGNSETEEPAPTINEYNKLSKNLEIIKFQE
jgi:hypothetical protein